MSRPLIFRRVARTEYVRAISWYEAEQPGLGADFEAKIEALLAIIAVDPNRYAIADRDTRVAPVQRFPYCVYYKVYPDRIDVLGVFHQSRDPSEWQSRS
jgi:hypothetical protein